MIYLYQQGFSINDILKGWNSQAHREFPGKFKSSNVSRDNVSREIGRKQIIIITIILLLLLLLLLLINNNDSKNNNTTNNVNVMILILSSFMFKRTE